MRILSAKDNNRGQEEMVGFALIIILVSIIILAFIGFSLNNHSSQSVQSYGAQSFVQSMIQTSTECTDYYGYVSVKDLIFMCNSGTLCSDNQDSCSILNSTLQDLLNQSWNVLGGGPIKGYSLNISSDTGNILGIISGNLTSSSEGASQDFSAPSGGNVNIVFNTYS
ncbi:MAG: hypothetical protein M1165_02430 [Candidatus Pacearchaeota archaeon]|nr:hypothetical protein [Candidatus Pacearchaeota archaeon]